ncbi:sensor histidine kinase [Micromonospora peucetia]|uniref:Histidine kinase n=1 Tax=Micromonospora peucetia TaxID=47871 RepID=A0A1C6VTJ2_9ACTN|nr:histidine kinase [Micromonospora peucetia]WSA31118.1 histidine kinase [Micromonospora peucetia]SCL69605.1 Signal transduction histidine kinase [Micromonospora peucetia]
MRRLGLDEWSGVVMLVVCVGVGSPVMLGLVEPDIPALVWVGLFVVTLGAALVSVVEWGQAAQRWAAYGTAVVAGWGVVATAPRAGMLPILLVVIAALGPETVRLPVNLLVIALNTVVIALTVSRIHDDPVEPLAAGVFYGLIQIATAFSVTAIRREQQHRRELAQAHVELRAASLLLAGSARTAERLRISRELHDLLGHQLTILTLELEAARHREGDPAREHVERAGRVAREVLADVRGTVSALRAGSAADLAEALRDVGRDIPGLDVTVEVGEDVEANEEQTAALVRAVQEIITNTLRHADARELGVTIVRDGDVIRLTAVDDGQGVRDVIPGNGLRGIAERFAPLGGEIAYDGSSGFRVTARMPAR